MNTEAVATSPAILEAGEFFHRVCFGSNTICRGAILMDCQWQGGRFESGHMLGGYFNGGVTLGGFFSGVTMVDCDWQGGIWHCGYSPDGLYEPRVHSSSNTAAKPVVLPFAESGSKTETLLIASPHLYVDLARLWYRTVQRVLKPFLESRGFTVEVLIFCDRELFPQAWFEGAILWEAGREAMDFIHFYDACLALHCDYLFYMDADIFFLKGEPLIPYLEQRHRADFAAISFLQDDGLPGSIYALLVKREVYARLPAPVLSARYDNAKAWPFNTHFDPGAYAAKVLQQQGKQIIVGQSPREFLVDFHGTTNLRITLEMFGNITDSEIFHYFQSKSYFLQSAYDNLVLAVLYQAVTGDDFAAEGGPSLSLEVVNLLLAKVSDDNILRHLQAVFTLSTQAVLKLAKAEGVAIQLPAVELPGRSDSSASFSSVSA